RFFGSERFLVKIDRAGGAFDDQVWRWSGVTFRHRFDFRTHESPPWVEIVRTLETSSGTSRFSSAFRAPACHFDSPFLRQQATLVPHQVTALRAQLRKRKKDIGVDDRAPTREASVSPKRRDQEASSGEQAEAIGAR